MARPDVVGFGGEVEDPFALYTEPLGYMDAPGAVSFSQPVQEAQQLSCELLSFDPLADTDNRKRKRPWGNNEEPWPSPRQPSPKRRPRSEDSPPPSKDTPSTEAPSSALVKTEQ
eukprot:Protomagalhaensia_sp_Gyna_25__1175@NODE_157_length_4767_cov_207_169628_g122_i0_p4_GENE_NODE_157_length_4767_cov_207_169628_g122_i0NODE_157_length_4767_cov_207_169628_g122_i0_p4_ORF_typecomplete_len114_score15_45_NODE_157_length_4767_cov_207_169628_g122_i035273868